MYCLNCSEEYSSKSQSSKYCSRKCAAIHRSKNTEYLDRLSESCRNAKRASLTEEHKLKISESIKKKGRRGKYSEETRKKIGEGHKGMKYQWVKNPGKKWTEERKRKWSIDNKGGKCEWYETIKPDGTIIKVQGFWEYQFSLYLNQIDPNWIKPTIWDRDHQFNWIDSLGNSHWYTPDFWSPLLKKYFEIKGFWTNSQQQKKEFVLSLSNVTIVNKDDMKKLGLKIKK
jgi:hypothetical protein